MQISSAFGGLAEVEVALPEEGDMKKKEFQRLDGATGDVSDAFYQFSVGHMAEWFGMDDPVTEAELGIGPGTTPMFPCFCGMPQGWTWALYFCNSAVQWAAEKAFGADGILVHSRPAPSIADGPVASIYVDNVMALSLPGQGASAYQKIRKEAVQMGFDLHEEEEGGTTTTNVGSVIDKTTGCLRHKRDRAWRLYRATKHMTGMRRLTGEAMRVWLGHAVHFCEMSRLSLSVLDACYKFVTAGLGTSSASKLCAS